jgi:glycosyltransferase involved in cell wall biosynthesis
MGYGLPTIVNANGSNAELPNEAVYRIEDNFEDKELVSALERLWADPLKRKKLGTRAREIVEQNHSPAVCAQRYAEALESLYNTDVNNRNHLIESLAAKVDFREEERMLHKTAACIAQNQPGKRPAKSFFVDISATCRKDLRTGIERVSKALLRELIIEPPAGYRIEPVYTATQNGQSSYRFARHYTLDFLQCPNYWLEDEIVEFQPGDKLLVADISGHFLFEAVKSGFYERIRNIGVRIYFIVFDLLPIKTPHFFPPDTGDAFESWLTSACSIADCALCISEATATDLKAWIDRASQKKLQSLKVSWFHLGADIDLPVFSKGLPKDVENLLRQLNKHPTFLIVGTIEPRKGHLQVMKAFELLWQKGIMANLLIVGKEGWKDLPEKSRRTIPLIVKILKNHAESNRRLFWLQDISDEFLERLYSVSVCLIAASEGEGFGLPLIEAARHNLPIIARDIPVFREIAGEHGYYFQGTAPEDLSEALKEWLKLYRGYKHPRSERIAWQTWAQSANQVKNIILKECSDII